MSFLKVAWKTTQNMKVVHSNIYHNVKVIMLSWIELLPCAKHFTCIITYVIINSILPDIIPASLYRGT